MNQKIKKVLDHTTSSKGKEVRSVCFSSSSSSSSSSRRRRRIGSQTMYIWNGFAKLLDCTRSGIRTLVSTICCRSPNQRSRRSSYPHVPDVSLLDQTHSLTSEYIDYGHSSRALQTCVFHTCTYYVTAVVLFSFVVQDWKGIDSLYYATTLFTTIG